MNPFNGIESLTPIKVRNILHRYCGIHSMELKEPFLGILNNPPQEHLNPFNGIESRGVKLPPSPQRLKQESIQWN